MLTEHSRHRHLFFFQIFSILGVPVDKVVQHNRFQIVVGKNHPSLYVFLKELQKEQADTEIMMRQLQLDQRVRKGIDRKRREYEEHLAAVVKNYSKYIEDNDVLSYLRTVGYHIKF